uniref:Integrase zinc-binding domain-containing protein n=1 Tax=Anopheles stephensi TaxID=30069 RepID=A0A182YRB9_ANOST
CSAALDVAFAAHRFWTDSTVVLNWLNTGPKAWKTFVAHRVAEIQLIKCAVWQHVSGRENPVDLISRGALPHQIIDNQLWKFGPAWLSEVRENCPEQRISEPNEVFTRYGSYQKLVKVVSYCIRFIRNARGLQKRADNITLTVNDISGAKKRLEKLVQTELFSSDLQRLSKGSAVARSSSLKMFNPFIDNDGIIRVGERLRQPDLPYDVKHQIVLPGFHPFTQLFIVDKHRKRVHGGISSTLSAVRDEICTINGKRAVRKAIWSCFRCCRANPQPITQSEGQLSKDTKAVHLELVGDLNTAHSKYSFDSSIGFVKAIIRGNGNYISKNRRMHDLAAVGSTIRRS